MDEVVTSDGVRLHVRDEGSGDVLLVVPGWAVSGWWFRHQFTPALTEKNRVVCYDPRGQGSSEMTERGQRVARYAADLAAVLDATGAEKVHLLAWSGGVGTALQYVELFGTGRLASMTMVGGGAKLVNSDGWDLGFMDLDGLRGWVSLIRDDFPTAVDTIIPAFFAEMPGPDDLAEIRAEMLRCLPAAMASASWDYVGQDFRDAVGLVDVPTLVVAGAKDGAIPAGNAPWLVERMPRARSVVMDGTAHCPFLERPDDFNALVREFLDSV
jgi:non-heme chloroperoxidase